MMESVERARLWPWMTRVVLSEFNGAPGGSNWCGVVWLVWCGVVW